MARTRDSAAFARRQAQILEAAAQLFAEHGFHQTGMAAICSAVGMSPGALYRYFPSKSAMISAIVEAEREQSLQLIDSIGSGPDLPQRLLDAIDLALTEVADPAYAKLALEVAAEAARDAELGTLIQRAEKQACERLATQLAAAKADGHLPVGVDPKASALLLLVVIDGACNGLGVSFSGLPPARRREALDRMLTGLLGLTG